MGHGLKVLMIVYTKTSSTNKMHIWCALKKLGAEEWLVRFVRSMRRNTQNCAEANGSFSLNDDYLVQIPY